MYKGQKLIHVFTLTSIPLQIATPIYINQPNTGNRTKLNPDIDLKK